MQFFDEFEVVLPVVDRAAQQRFGKREYIGQGSTQFMRQVCKELPAHLFQSLDLGYVIEDADHKGAAERSYLKLINPRFAPRQLDPRLKQNSLRGGAPKGVVDGR